jgi:hypothetical protein
MTRNLDEMRYDMIPNKNAGIQAIRREVLNHKIAASEVLSNAL